MEFRFVRKALFGFAAVVGFALCPLIGRADDNPAEKPSRPWALAEAFTQVVQEPRDPYLQFVAFQLALRERNFEDAGRLERALNRGATRRSNLELMQSGVEWADLQPRLQRETLLRSLPQRSRPQSPAEKKQRAGLEQRLDERMPLASLAGPELPRPSWEQMLAGKKPELSPLARLVPEDFYFVEFRSLNKFADLADNAQTWGGQLLTQISRDGRLVPVGDRLKQQLALEDNRLLRTLADLVIEEVALVGSDLHFRDGNDVTFLFKLKQPALFKSNTETELANAVKAHPEARRSKGEYLGVAYESVTTPDRAVSAYAAFPADDVHIRSNSQVALERILRIVKGKDAPGQPSKSLADTPGFAAARATFPHGAKEEDGFVYLSEPFLRQQLGPRLKITERRRLLVANHLAMIGHGALFYRTQEGKPAGSFAELIKARYLPEGFGESVGEMGCPFGGTYSLSSDGMVGVNSVCGQLPSLTPCCELAFDAVSGDEANAYRAFVEDFKRSGKTNYAPLALRFQAVPKQYRLEALIPPLPDHALFNGLVKFLGGQPETLASFPTPERNLGSVVVRLHKEAVFGENGGLTGNGLRLFGIVLGIPLNVLQSLPLTELAAKGLGNQVGVHFYDAPPSAAIQLAGFWGEEQGNGRRLSGLLQNPELKLFRFLATGLQQPIYVSFPVQDTKLVDRFLDSLDDKLTALTARPARGLLAVRREFARREKNDTLLRIYAVRLALLHFRLCWARIGNVFYFASQPEILTDLQAAETARAGKDNPESDAIGHAVLRLRLNNAHEAVADLRRNWADNLKAANALNLSLLNGVARAFPALSDRDTSAAEKRTAEVIGYAERLHGVRFVNPEGGVYAWSPASQIGSTVSPLTLAGVGSASAAGTLDALLRQFPSMTATLTVGETGARVVVAIERRE